MAHLIEHISIVQITNSIKMLLSTQEFSFDQIEALWLAVDIYEKNNVDFADTLIGEIKGCDITYTLDIAASVTCSDYRKISCYKIILLKI